MRVIESVSEMQQQADSWRRQDLTIGLVPTMGYLHRGHSALVQKAMELADRVVVSIFVNPTQFGPNEDFERYPQDLPRDLRLLDELGVGTVFKPAAAEIYPQGYQTYVEVQQLTQPLCGRSRPIHFRGVATVVNKLFNIIKPHLAVFGEKDFQQLLTIRRMVADLNMDVEIIGHPIVREPDGLAMSSRNAYLNAAQRQTALRLVQSLEQARRLVAAGERQAQTILTKVKAHLLEGEGITIDYAELCDLDTLRPVTSLERPGLLAMAAYLGPARLLDNCILTPPGAGLHAVTR